MSSGFFSRHPFSPFGKKNAIDQNATCAKVSISTFCTLASEFQTAWSFVFLIFLVRKLPCENVPKTEVRTNEPRSMVFPAYENS